MFDSNPNQLANNLTRGGIRLEVALEGALDQCDLWSDLVEATAYKPQREAYLAIAEAYGQAAIILLQRLNKKQRRAARLSA